MSWREAQLSIQLLAEERVGSRQRLALLEAKAQEDAAMEHAAAVLAP